jgi:cytochrome c-type biogenesis protein
VRVPLFIGEVVGLVLDGPLLAAMLVAAAAGAVSFFSPCCLPLVPGYLSYITGFAGAGLADRRDGPTEPRPVIRPLSLGIRSTSGRTPTAGGAPLLTAPGNPIVDLPTPAPPPAARPEHGSPRAAPEPRVMLAAALFVVGFAAVFTAYGVLFGGVGTFLIRQQEMLTRVLGAATLILGLVFAGVFQRVPFFRTTIRWRYRPGAGLAGAPLVGALFGIGWTPCMGPTLAAVLLLATQAGTAGRGAVLSFAYSLGLGIPFLLTAAGLRRGLRRFGWASRHGLLVTRIGAALLVALGLLQVTGAWTSLMAALRGSVVSFSVPL